MEAIKRVYASTFSQHAKAYVRATPYRLEEEKMAVIIQQVVGDAHGSASIPISPACVRSRNFYPVAPMRPGGRLCCRRSWPGPRGRRWRQVPDASVPRYPRHLVQFSSVEDMLANSQTGVLGAGSGPRMARAEPEGRPSRGAASARTSPKPTARLHLLGSTYSADNHAVYDGLSRPGARIVSFAPILKHGLFPLPRVLDQLMTASAKRHWAVRWRSSSPCACRSVPDDASRVWLPADAAAGDVARGRRHPHRSMSTARKLLCHSSQRPGPRPHSGLCATSSWSTSIASSAPTAMRWPRASPHFNAQAQRDRHALPADRRRPLGLERSLAGHSGGLGPDLRRARHRRSRVSAISASRPRRAATSSRTSPPFRSATSP